MDIELAPRSKYAMELPLNTAFSKCFNWSLVGGGIYVEPLQRVSTIQCEEK